MPVLAVAVPSTCCVACRPPRWRAMVHTRGAHLLHVGILLGLHDPLKDLLHARAAASRAAQKAQSQPQREGLRSRPAVRSPALARASSQQASMPKPRYQPRLP